MKFSDNSAVPGAQQSAEWFQQRMGKLTASSMAAAMDFLKNGSESVKRRDLKIAILAERMTNIIRAVYVTPAMQWGTDHESAAKLAYMEATGEKIAPAGFCEHASIENFGASPDGFIGDDGLVEVKCPTSETYLRWVIAGEVPDEYKPQMLAQVACTGRKWVQFIAFEPRMPEGKRLFMRRYTPIPADVEAVEFAARKLLDEVDAMFDAICAQS